MKLKVFYIISDIDKSISFEWIASDLQKQYQFKFILITNDASKLLAYVRDNKYDHYHVSTAQNIFFKWIKIFAILFREKPTVVHTHLWQANLLGLTSSWLLAVPKRIFTRHHAMVHYNEFPSGRKWDMFCNFLATHIIAISSNVRNILVEKDKADSRKIQIIHHGFPASYFERPDQETINELRIKYQVNENTFPVIGVIARYMEWKGVHYIIPAFKKLLQRHPNAHLILANAHGPFEKEIKAQLKSLPTSSYTEILFETELSALYQLFHLYVHVPVDPEVEAFGQTYVEALAAGIPSVFTLSGIAPDFIENYQNAIVVPFKDEEAILHAFESILGNEELRMELIRNGKRGAALFNYERMVSQLINLYES
jgi:glycosyltransferase involved in cell wall biosynthesis